MPELDVSHSAVMARLTMSALERASRDPSCWREPTVHRALLVSGLSVLTESMRRLQHDLETMPRENISGDDSPSVG
ncbi:hypothetical protein [Synechococcus sp. KORDI-100]|uniref:hypothetical protein n=1 Tax=Synechococcus sp. KORDI-100 TaxID=1280380 RepID=UPI000570E6FF|nr:hypothetical protein [Synechococcus sp. KORDI-100]